MKTSFFHRILTVCGYKSLPMMIPHVEKPLFAAAGYPPHQKELLIASWSRSSKLSIHSILLCTIYTSSCKSSCSLCSIIGGILKSILYMNEYERYKTSWRNVKTQHQLNHNESLPLSQHHHSLYVQINRLLFAKYSLKIIFNEKRLKIISFSDTYNCIKAGFEHRWQQI